MKLSAQDLAVKLGTRKVLSGVSLEIAPAQVTAVIGPNGAGKSTLLRALAGVLELQRGTVTLEGRPLATYSAAERARSIGYLPQSRTVHWPLTVARTVALGRAPHKSGAASNQIAIDEAMREMDVIAFRDRSVTELSGGELARVLMARVLAQQTPILLVDEPTAGLDPAHQIGLLERLQSLAANGRTVVIAMHDLSLAARYCKRVVLLKAGRIVGNGEPSAVLTEALLADVFGIRAKVTSIDGIAIVLPVGVC